MVQPRPNTTAKTNDDSYIWGDIVGQLFLTQATVSQHLKELKNAGIIKGNVDGASIEFDYIITVCDNAKEHYPFFPSKAQRFHSNYRNQKATGAEEEIKVQFLPGKKSGLIAATL